MQSAALIVTFSVTLRPQVVSGGALYDISPRFYGWVLAQQEHLADFPLLERYCDDLDLVIRQQVKTPVTELYLKLV